MVEKWQESFWPPGYVPHSKVCYRLKHQLFVAFLKLISPIISPIFPVPKVSRVMMKWRRRASHLGRFTLWNNGRRATHLGRFTLWYYCRLATQLSIFALWHNGRRAKQPC